MWKIQTPAPLVKVVYIWNVDYFDFGFDPPPLWTFSTIFDISFLDCSPRLFCVQVEVVTIKNIMTSRLNKLKS